MFLSTSVVAGLFFTSVSTQVKRGEALFTGKERLKGRVRGHDELLPTEDVRCVNCHGGNRRSLSRVSAPKLDAALLQERRQRRGGPPSHYDAFSFCKLLRTGADASYILIAREMPVYDLTDRECDNLWAFLIEGKSSEKR